MKPTVRQTTHVFISIGLTAITGCATMNNGCGTPKPPPPTPPLTISCIVPNIAPLPQTQPSQTNGDLVITITPVLYKAVHADKLSITPVEPNLGEGIGALGMGNPGPGYVFVQETVTPQLKPQPDRLQFAVRINNQMSRVFRGQGAVVQINVGGKLMPILGKDYADFVNSIVPPRNETEVMIYGPSLDAMREMTTIGIFLYDVVIKEDAVGNVIAKKNYEWYFSYEPKTVQDTGQASTKRHWITVAEYSQKLRTQQFQQIQRSIPQPLPTSSAQ